MPREIGTRIGAVSHSDKDTIYIFGFGTYAGDEVPETAGGWMAEGLREYNIPNPKLVLDSGKVVWGCECWWGSEERVRKELEGRTVVEIDIDEARRAASEGQEQTQTDN
jgi:hypothetical protein